MKKLILFIFLVSLCSGLYAKEETTYSSVPQTKYTIGSKEKPIRVGVMLVEPFASIHDGVYEGLVIDYWKQIANENNWHYVFLDTNPNYTTSLRDMEISKYDLILGNYSTTAKRLSFINYSRPYMLNKISILTKDNRPSTLTIFLTVLFIILKILLAILMSIGIFTIFMWLFKKKDDPTSLKVFFLVACNNIFGAADKKDFKNIL